MNFIEAIDKLQKGSKVYREQWLEQNNCPYFIYYYVDECDGYLDEKENEYSFCNDDYLANDWKVIGDKLYTFEEALKAFREGKSIRKASFNKINLYGKLVPIKHEYIQRYSLISIEDMLSDDWEILP